MLGVKNQVLVFRIKCLFLGLSVHGLKLILTENLIISPLVSKKLTHAFTHVLT